MNDNMYMVHIRNPSCLLGLSHIPSSVSIVGVNSSIIARVVEDTWEEQIVEFWSISSDLEPEVTDFCIYIFSNR